MDSSNREVVFRVRVRVVREVSWCEAVRVCYPPGRGLAAIPCPTAALVSCWGTLGVGGTLGVCWERCGAARAPPSMVVEDILALLPSYHPVWKSTSVSGAPDNSSLSHFSAMTRPSWLGRAARNRHRHAIEQASRRWRGGRRDDSARTRRKKFDFHTGALRRDRR